MFNFALECIKKNMTTSLCGIAPIVSAAWQFYLGPLFQSQNDLLPQQHIGNIYVPVYN